MNRTIVTRITRKNLSHPLFADCSEFGESCGTEISSPSADAVPDVDRYYQSNVPGLYVIGALVPKPFHRRRAGVSGGGNPVPVAGRFGAFEAAAA